MMRREVTTRIKIMHKSFMTKEYYLDKCTNCKHRESTKPIIRNGETVGWDVSGNYNDDVCKYPYATKCMKRSVSYKFGFIIAIWLLLIFVCILGYVGINIVEWIWNFLRSLIT